MKYKNIVLKEGPDSTAELSVLIAFENREENDAVDVKMLHKIKKLYVGFEPAVVFENVSSGLILVRCWHIRFDKPGVELLKRIYDQAFGHISAEVLVGVHVDGDEWFKREDGSPYNEDTVIFSEFAKNIVY